MAGGIEIFSKFEVMTEGVSQREIHRRLVRVYGQKVFSGEDVPA
jgi:cytochrome c-type biogenesis protein CcmH/NrfF